MFFDSLRLLVVEQQGQPARQDSHVFVLALRCVECNRRWDDVNERWRVYFTDDEPPEPVTYCPGCAKREFND
jgi:hypothetical protein